MIVVARPVAEVGGLNLVERHRRRNAVEASLDQGRQLARRVGFRAHPMRCPRLRRPQHHDRQRRLYLLFYDFGIAAVGGELGVPPDPIAGCAKRVLDPLRFGLTLACIGNKDVGHGRRATLMPGYRTRTSAQC